MPALPASALWFDALGQRVEKNGGGAKPEYIYGIDGNVLAEVNGSNGGWQVGYVYLGGQLLAQYSNGTTYFAHSDHLGSTRVLTKVDASGYENYDYLRFGETRSGGWGTTHKFTGDERDSESGLDHTLFRQYSSLDRWSSPDPLAGDISDPQSLNRYAYVRNNPLGLTDPLGADPSCGDGGRPCPAISEAGDDFNCTFDGIPTSCLYLQHAAQNGDAQPCPNNDCSNAVFDSSGMYTRTGHLPNLTLYCAWVIGPTADYMWDSASRKYIQNPDLRLQSFLADMKAASEFANSPDGQRLSALSNAGSISAPMNNAAFPLVWYGSQLGGFGLTYVAPYIPPAALVLHNAVTSCACSDTCRDNMTDLVLGRIPDAEDGTMPKTPVGWAFFIYGRIHQ